MSEGMQLIGAGFGRTGTTSTLEALDELGYKTYHMRESMHFAGHPSMWTQAARSGGKNVDWDDFFKTPTINFTATVDWPACDFYKSLMLQYPDAKVILHVRDFESWYKSMTTTVYAMYDRINSPLASLLRFIPFVASAHRYLGSVIWEETGTFHGRFLDKEYVHKIFNDRIEEVKNHVPKEKLLVFDVKDGWEPLCRFLNKPIPDHPFPRVNEAARFEKVARFLKIVSLASWVVPAALFGVLSYYANHWGWLQ